MKDVQWLKLDITLPHYVEEVTQNKVNLSNETELNNFHQFRNELEKLIDIYYGGKK
jgi:hypothetical protein|tara:strand:+ start:585 stop:752 length:168 start_codon:yes stop_codon:yes gene_type:complete